jgi:bifunctional non-homologous end joining protein LigD
VDKPPAGDDWAHEIKHDGYRLQIHVGSDGVRLYTMSGYDWTDRYPQIVAVQAQKQHDPGCGGPALPGPTV